MRERVLIAVAALSAALAIAAGAFGAHGIADAKAAEWLGKGAHYQLINAAAALALGLTGRFRPQAWLLIVGAALFAGTLYAMALGAPRWLGAVTPVGGSLMIVGWLWMAVAAFRSQES